MAIPKVCGIETEYGIVVRGGGESNPIAASSLLINAYVAAREPPRGRVGWDFEDESPGQRRPGLRARRRAGRPRSRRTSSTRCSPTAPATTSTTPTPRSRRPSAPTPREVVRVRPGRRGDRAPLDGRGARACCPTAPGDRRLQEQLRRQGQQLRLPRELPDGPRGAVRPHRRPGHAALRHPPDLHRRRQGRLRGCPGVADRRRAVPAQPAGRLLRGGGRARDHAEAARSSTPATSRTATPQKYRRLHVIVGDANLSEVATFLKVGTTAIVLAMIEDDALRRRPGCSPARCRRSARSATTSTLTRTIDAAPTAAGDRARDPVGAARAGPQVRARRTGSTRVGEEVGADVLRRWEAVLTGLEPDPMSLADQVDWVAKHRLLDGYARAPRPRLGRRPAARRSTCSTTTCAPSKSPGRPGRAGAPHRPTTRSSGR